MQLSTAILVALALMVPVAEAQVIEFKGTPLGAPYERFKADHPDFKCVTYGTDGGSCTSSSNAFVAGLQAKPSTFAGETVSFVVATFHGGVFASMYITISPDSYGAIRGALAEKYGRPRTATETVINGFGVSAENESSFWDRPDGLISLERYSGTLDEGSVHFRSTAEGQRQADESKKRAADRKSDL